MMEGVRCLRAQLLWSSSFKLLCYSSFQLLWSSSFKLLCDSSFLRVFQQLPAAIFQQFQAALLQQLPAALVQQLPTALAQQLPAALPQQLPAALPQQLPAALVQQLPAAFSHQLPIFNSFIWPLRPPLHVRLPKLRPPIWRSQGWGMCMATTTKLRPTLIVSCWPKQWQPYVGERAQQEYAPGFLTQLPRPSMLRLTTSGSRSTASLSIFLSV